MYGYGVSAIPMAARPVKFAILRALAAADLGFAACGTALLLIYVGLMAHLDPWPPLSMLLFGGTPLATVAYGLALAATDFVFRRVGVESAALHALTAAAGACAILLPVGAVFHGWDSVAWWPALIAPGAAIGGLVLAHYRHR